MNATRCKVRLVSISGGYYGTDKGRTVEFRAVSDGSEENKRFFAATPFAFRDDDPLRVPGEIPPGWRGEYLKIVRKLVKSRPGASAEAVRAEACRILKDRNV